MATEIMGLLILLGAGLLVLARWQSRRQAAPREEQQGMQDATQRLKEELERTGNEITARMGSHVERLEQLLAEAERSRELLDSRISKLHELTRLGDQQMSALHTLRAELAEARRLRDELAAYEDWEEPAQAPAPGPAPAPRDFSRMLRQTMARDEALVQEAARKGELQEPAPRPFPAAPEVLPGSPSDMGSRHIGPQDEEPPGREDASPEEPEDAPRQDAPAQEPSMDSARVRSLLLSGWTVEEVARETGMGRGAVELMQQVIRRQMQ